jgi:hypothetical protein
LNRPTVPEVLPLVRAIYERNGVGCCLHILTDDGNVDNGSAQFCLETAKARGHADCIAAAEMLVKMSKTQRSNVGAAR